MNARKSLVSVLIPAYNITYFEQALASALGQTWPDMEIVVSDDSCKGEIQAVCESIVDRRLRYVKNRRNLGFSGNFTQCLNLARGELIKFLNDDDLLHPLCVEHMVSAFEEYGEEVRLVTSKRRIIDASGKPQQDVRDTLPLSSVDALVKGVDVGNLLLQRSVNFIGEPTTVMFRKSALQWDGENIFRLASDEYICLADVSLWLRLLSAGKAVYLANELSYFRVHDNQEQKKPDVALRCITERCSILAGARELGFLEDKSSYLKALRAVLEIYQQSLSSGRLSTDIRETLEKGRDWLSHELLHTR